MPRAWHGSGDAPLHPQTASPAPGSPLAELGILGHPPARRGGTWSLGRACAGATPGDIRELKISRFSCNRLALAPAAPAARGGARCWHSPPPGHGERGAGMEPAGAARAGCWQDLPDASGAIWGKRKKRFICNSVGKHSKQNLQRITCRDKCTCYCSAQPAPGSSLFPALLFFQLDFPRSCGVPGQDRLPVHPLEIQ